MAAVAAAGARVRAEDDGESGVCVEGGGHAVGTTGDDGGVDGGDVGSVSLAIGAGGAMLPGPLPPPLLAVGIPRASSCSSLKTSDGEASDASSSSSSSSSSPASISGCIFLRIGSRPESVCLRVPSGSLSVVFTMRLVVDLVDSSRNGDSYLYL